MMERERESKSWSSEVVAVIVGHLFMIQCNKSVLMLQSLMS